MNSLPTLPSTDRYLLQLASDVEDVRAAQQLRFRVFNLELHEGLSDAYLTGLDADPFDDVCDHLLVRERETCAVVGTYRLQTGANAARHHGYYCEREFRFETYEAARGEILELGRACTAAEHRNQIVLGLLWKGIAQYARARQARYLVGCSSLTSQDEGAALAVYRELAPAHLVDAPWRTAPQAEWRCSPAAALAQSQPLPVPRLMRAYLALGAKICGEPALDREFSTIDFLTWLDLHSLTMRVMQKFFG